MATGYGRGFMPGLLEGVQVGHGIKQDRIQNERQAKLDTMRETTFENQQQELDYQRQQRKMKSAALRVRQATHDDTGKLKAPESWDTAALTKVGNELDVFKQYLAQNPEVDQDNPLLEVRPFKTKDGTKLTFRLNRADGGNGVLTEDRGSGPESPVVTMAPDELMNELSDVFASYGIPRFTDPHAWDREQMKLQHGYKMEEIGAKGIQDRKTQEAKPGSKDDDYEDVYKSGLPKDMESLFKVPMTDQETGAPLIDLVKGGPLFKDDLERKDKFIRFWADSKEENPRKAYSDFTAAEQINQIPAEKLVSELSSASPEQKMKTVRLLTPEKRAEIRRVLNGESRYEMPGPPMATGPGHQPMAGRGLQQ